MNAPLPQITDEEIAATSPSGTVRLAAGLQIGSGVVVALTAVQTLLSIRFNGALPMLPGLLAVCGLAAIPIGAQVYRMREQFARIGFVLHGVVALGQVMWLLMSFVSGLFSCLGIIAAPLAVLAFVLAYFAIGPCKRATEIRARMLAAGLDLGR